MPTDQVKKELAVADYSLEDLATLMIREKNIHEGRYTVALEFQISIGAIGQANEVYPGASMAIRRVGLVTAKGDAAHSVDASEVNPLKPKPGKKSTK
jgi:hypothetical protein